MIQTRFLRVAHLELLDSQAANLVSISPALPFQSMGAEVESPFACLFDAPRHTP
jgi:hypothetical protein